MKSILKITAIGFLTMMTVAAQPAAKPARQVRFLAVGDWPPFIQEIRDGVRYELDPPAGSIPPREVIPGFGKQTLKPVSLHLGRISDPVELPAGAGELALRQGNGASPSTLWMRLDVPEAGDFLIFLVRRSVNETWENAASLIVPDGSAGAPAGTVRIVNLLPLSIHLLWGGEELLLPAGRTIQRTANPDADTTFQILAPNEAGELKRYYAGSVAQNQAERGIITIYQSNGVDSRRPVKVLMLREPAF